MIKIKVLFVILVFWLSFSPIAYSEETVAISDAKPKEAALVAVSTKTETDEDVYRIQPGDKLNIQVYNEKELSGVFLVDSGGMINYPLLGEIRAVNLSVDTLKRILIQKLGDDYLVNPQVDVDFAESSSKSISVLGEVVKPGNYVLTPNLTMAKLVPQLGGFRPDADPKNVKISRVSKGNKRRTVDVDAEGILNGTTEDVRLWPGDMIFVATKKKEVIAAEQAKEINFVTVFGQVKSPGNHPIDKDMTMIKLLGKVGGFTDTAATNRVRIVRKAVKGDSAKVFVVDVGAILSGHAPDFKLEPGDLVVVEESFW